MSIYKVNRHLMGDFVLSLSDEVHRVLSVMGFLFSGWPRGLELKALAGQDWQTQVVSV